MRASFTDGERGLSGIVIVHLELALFLAAANKLHSGEA
jgi:hypothetical protein